MASEALLFCVVERVTDSFAVSWATLEPAFPPRTQVGQDVQHVRNGSAGIQSFPAIGPQSQEPTDPTVPYSSCMKVGI